MNYLRIEMDCLPISPEPILLVELMIEHADVWRPHASWANPREVPIDDRGQPFQKMHLGYHFGIHHLPGASGPEHRFSHGKTQTGVRVTLKESLSFAISLSASVELFL